MRFSIVLKCEIAFVFLLREKIFSFGEPLDKLISSLPMQHTEIGK